jgi:gamma-glutamylcyclotransferase (GGCT)/AIG2-like uncharacterized protein YtfP
MHEASARHVFVYGTLRAGGSNDIARFRPPARLVGRGEIAGTLYDLGAYPGATLGGSSLVCGEVYRIDPVLEVQLDLLEEVRLDDEGEYRKRELAVQVGAQRIDCLVYEIHPRRIAGRPVIESGDWLAQRA